MQLINRNQQQQQPAEQRQKECIQAENVIMLDLLARFCAPRNGGAQIFNNYVIHALFKSVLLNTGFYPCCEITANLQKYMQLSTTDRLNIFVTNIAYRYRNAFCKITAGNITLAGFRLSLDTASQGKGLFLAVHWSCE